jgi:tetratricopeptide (TPR) repeat protein
MPSLRGDPQKLVYTLHNLANVHRAMEQPELALVCLRQADEVCHAPVADPALVSPDLDRAHDLQQGRTASALSTYREAIELSRRARHAEARSIAADDRRGVLFGLCMRDKRCPISAEAAGLFAQLEDRPRRPRCGAARRSSSPAIAGRWNRARHGHECWRCVSGWATCEDNWTRSTGSPKPFADRGITSRHPGLEAALHLASTLGECRALSLRNTLGILEWTRGRFDAALAHYEAALLLVRGQGDRVQEGRSSTASA